MTPLVPSPRLGHRRRSRINVRSQKIVRYPAISLWRTDLITTGFSWRGNDKLYCYRYHPHQDRSGASCSGRFMFTGEQIEVLLEFWSEAPLWHRNLPQIGKTRCQARRLPDGGLQLTRFDQHRKVAVTFRIFAGDVAALLSFAEQGLPRI